MLFYLDHSRITDTDFKQKAPLDEHESEGFISEDSEDYDIKELG